MQKIGFIGLGHMGAPMAANLIKAGFDLSVYDVVSDHMGPLLDLGAKRAYDIASLASNSDVIFTSVQTHQQVSEICLNEKGLFAHAKPGSLYIDCSSIDIAVTRKLHAEARKHNIAMLDAPVSGGVAGAKAATLTFMVGGKQSDFEKAQAILNMMGKKIIYAGDEGNGQAAKICNNLLLGISMIGTCEAFSLAKKLGLDQKKFFEISSNASGQCWSMTSYCPVPGILDNVPSNHDYEPGFMAKMMAKDLHLGQLAAQSVDASIPLGDLSTKLYDLYVEQGFGDKDFSGIIHFIAGK